MQGKSKQRAKGPVISGFKFLLTNEVDINVQCKKCKYSYNFTKRNSEAFTFKCGKCGGNSALIRRVGSYPENET